ncbi:hypothetical protein [Bacillus rhizoplanae]|uniref:hypothetical protein n=1 Tax=Bacillus rhizoplanae TaxID=2880966 RepID=UPI003D1F37C2
MRPLVVSNVHGLYGQDFLVAFLYEDGHVIGDVIAPVDANTSIAKVLRGLVWGNCNDLPSFDLYTSTDAIYNVCLSAIDITAQKKVQDYTSETERCFNNAKVQEALIDLYDLKPNAITQVKQVTKRLTKYEVFKQWLRSLTSRLTKPTNTKGENA